MSNRITVLQARGPRLAKTIQADGSLLPYADARHFDMGEEAVQNLLDLAELLHALAPRPDLAIVRAAIADPARVRGVRRLLHPDPETGDAATLRAVPQPWAALDMDGLPAPAGLNPRDLAGCAEVLRAALPQWSAPQFDRTPGATVKA